MEEGFARSIIRAPPPCHFSFKIESFSSLSTCSLERYESCIFEASDYKWRLAIYPNGNNKLGDDDDGKNHHISLYLLLEKSCLTDLAQQISVTFNFLVYDKIRDKYLSVQGASRFHAMKLESGIDKFLSLEIFNDSSNGYLVNDTCMFGIDVFVMKNATTGRCLSMVAVKPVPFTYTWKIKKVSKLKEQCYFSDKFTTGGHDWKIQFHPKGYDTNKGNYLSLFLNLVDANPLQAGTSIFVEFKLRLVNQLNKNHNVFSTTYFFSAATKSWGWPGFLNLTELNKSTGYLVKDTCILETDIIVLGSSKNWV